MPIESTPHRATRLPASSPLRKVVLIRPLEDVGLAGGDADAVVDHEFGEAGSVDEDDLLADLGDVVAGGFGKAAGGDEDAFVGFVRGEGADEVALLICSEGVQSGLSLRVALAYTPAPSH